MLTDHELIEIFLLDPANTVDHFSVGLFRAKNYLYLRSESPAIARCFREEKILLTRNAGIPDTIWLTLFDAASLLGYVEMAVPYLDLHAENLAYLCRDYFRWREFYRAAPHEPGRDELEVRLEACAMRIFQYAEVSGFELPSDVDPRNDACKIMDYRRRIALT